MAWFGRVNIAKLSYTYYDVLVVDKSAGEFVFGSIVGYDTLLKVTAKEVNKVNSVYIDGHGYCRTVSKGYNVEKKKQSSSDFSHLVISKKDFIGMVKVGKDEVEKLIAYVYYKNDQELYNAVFDKLYKHTSIPVIEQWIPYIVNQMRTNSTIKNLEVYSDTKKAKPFNCSIINISIEEIKNIVVEGLQSRAININNRHDVSDIMTEINGLDDYLNCFGDVLAERIQQSFVPKFIPGESPYTEYTNNFDDSCYHNGIEMFEAQKAVIQASVNNLNKNDVTFVIGEMGTGKTLMGAGIAYAHHQKNGFNAVVLCPAHLTNKWQREIERLVPNGRGYIIRNMDELLALDDKIRNPKKKENTFLIMSKESAKFTYEKRPCALWSTRLRETRGRAFVCPECGQVLLKKITVWEDGRKVPEMVPLEKRDFTKENAINMECNNSVPIWSNEEGKYVTSRCGAKLWTPLNRDDAEDTGWIKLGSEGWIMKQHVAPLFNEMANMETINRRDAAFFEKLSEKYVEMTATGDAKSSTKGPRKYSLAKYIRTYYKGIIDYALLDELHLYKGDTEQGQAAGDLIAASNKKICLTGTLLNGYADGLFYILFRTLPAVMRKEGFDFTNEMNFMRTFGVIKKSGRFEFMNGHQGERIGTGSEKRLPGVSPLVFTKFLLENAVFISLSDMAEGLPEYTEIPISIKMDDELKEGYSDLETRLRRETGGRGSGMKIMGALLQSLSVYPDMPYNQPPIIHPDTGEVLVVPPTLPQGYRNKERSLLELVQRKKEAGEKVLVYYSWTNRTDIAQKLTALFTENDIRSCVMTSTNPKKAELREAWIQDRTNEGIDVLICNPALVETGLDLLDFTTIVFYQVGYNIFTMRQASRRSWRLSQTHAIEVYFMYYEETIQEQALSLMATKLQASMAIEGRFSEEGLRAMSNNEDLLTQIANSVVNGIKHTVNAEVFSIMMKAGSSHRTHRVRKPMGYLIEKYYDKPKDFTLSYLKRRTVQTTDPTSTHEIMKAIFNKKQHIGNLM